MLAPASGPVERGRVVDQYLATQWFFGQPLLQEVDSVRVVGHRRSASAQCRGPGAANRWPTAIAPGCCARARAWHRASRRRCPVPPPPRHGNLRRCREVRRAAAGCRTRKRSAARQWRARCRGYPPLADSARGCTHPACSVGVLPAGSGTLRRKHGYGCRKPRQAMSGAAYATAAAARWIAARRRCACHQDGGPSQCLSSRSSLNRVDDRASI